MLLITLTIAPFYISVSDDTVTGLQPAQYQTLETEAAECSAIIHFNIYCIDMKILNVVLDLNNPIATSAAILLMQ